MIPIHDDVPSSSAPVATVALIAVNTLIWLFAVSLPEARLEELYSRFGVVPATIHSSPLTALGLLPLLTSTFFTGASAI